MELLVSFKAFSEQGDQFLHENDMKILVIDVGEIMPKPISVSGALCT